MIDPIETIKALEPRIHTACLTVRTLPPDGPKGFFSTWPAYRLSHWDAEEEGSKRGDAAITEGLIKPPRFVPSAKEIDDCLPALSLLEGIAPFTRVVVSMRAHQLWYDLHGGWRAVGDRLKVSHKTARLHHWKAMRWAFAQFCKRLNAEAASGLTPQGKIRNAA